MNKKNLWVLNYVASVCFFLAAIIGFANDNSMAPVWMCLGAAWLCIGAGFQRKNKKDDSEDDKK